MADSSRPAFTPPPNPYAAPRAAIAPDAFAADAAAPAGRSQRLRATIVDYLIFVIPVAIMTIPMALLGGSNLVINLALLAGGLGFLGILVWNGLLLARNGQTIGKRSVGIRVVRTDGADAGFVRLFFLRGGLAWLITALPAIGGLFALVNVLFIFRNDRRCLHDLIADTRVVDAE